MARGKRNSKGGKGKAHRPYGEGYHGPSIHNPHTYEALRRKGMSKRKAAMISNGVLKRGVKKGVHGRSKAKKLARKATRRKGRK